MNLLHFIIVFVVAGLLLPLNFGGLVLLSAAITLLQGLGFVQYKENK